MKTDYLSRPLRQRAFIRSKDPVNFAKYPQAVGGIWTKEGRGSSFECGPSGVMAWIESPDFRFVGPSHEILPRLRHKGWFADDQCGEVTMGVVYRLSHGRFVAGCSDPWNCDKRGAGPFLLEDSVFDCPEEAARRADRLAEIYGEFLRADAAKQQAKEELAQLREDARELVAGIRQSRLAPSVCDRLRRDFKALRRDMSKLWRAIEA